MKNIAFIIIGFIFLIFVIICPFPAILSVSGIIWRIIIGFMSCFLLILGIYKTIRKR